MENGSEGHVRWIGGPFVEGGPNSTRGSQRLSVGTLGQVFSVTIVSFPLTSKLNLSRIHHAVRRRLRQKQQPSPIGIFVDACHLPVSAPNTLPLEVATESRDPARTKLRAPRFHRFLSV